MGQEVGSAGEGGRVGGGGRGGWGVNEVIDGCTSFFMLSFVN